ncbi:MAG: flagellar hook protein [Buchnera aphidicola (Pentalonia nigronervosa)]|jgi:flagellar hook-associated protein 1 FlgK|uniref:Flagellar hook-associated protein 1 n=1 Tax=Buchnera aphidicola (Pentalonia nigronervosa) TaxID=1309793 RepID=A0A7H1AZW9_9GAMM|nr:MAG: flagellar hook protein [Buchnera aphidicola (Pentalonia nigronervosa)]
MTSILNTAMTSINTIKTIIDQTINKTNDRKSNNPTTDISIKNTKQDESLNTAIKVREIYEDYNTFINEEKRKTSAQVVGEQTTIDQLLKLDDLFCEKSNIFNDLIRILYDKIENDITENDINADNISMKNQLKEIIFSLKDFDIRLQNFEKDIKESVIKIVTRANFLIDQIRDINIDIHYSPSVQLSNILIEKRDELVDELNDLIGVKVVQTHDSYKLYLNNGLCIIDNDKKQNLISLTSRSDDQYINVGYFDSLENKVKKIEYTIPNGSLGALLRFRREELNNAKNKLGQLTINFTDSINGYHNLGYNAFGNTGKQVFYIFNPEIIASSTNQSSPSLSANWLVTSSAKDSDYILYFKDNTWKITRLSDHAILRPDIYQDSKYAFMMFDGIVFQSHGAVADGDIYMIKPFSKTLKYLELSNNQDSDLLKIASQDDDDQISENEARIIAHLNHGVLINDEGTIQQAYKKFHKSILDKSNAIEEKLPFKKNMIEILRNKKISMSDSIEKNYQDVNYQQECYLASVKVLQVAEKIFNEIVECYS